MATQTATSMPTHPHSTQNPKRTINAPGWVKDTTSPDTKYDILHKNATSATKLLL